MGKRNMEIKARQGRIGPGVESSRALGQASCWRRGAASSMDNAGPHLHMVNDKAARVRYRCLSWAQPSGHKIVSVTARLVDGYPQLGGQSRRAAAAVGVPQREGLGKDDAGRRRGNFHRTEREGKPGTEPFIDV